MTIRFHFQSQVTLRDRNQLRVFIRGIFKKEKTDFGHLDIIFCSDDFLLEINRSHLNHDYYTDIITFDLSDTSFKQGEIYISIDRVRDNASQFSSPQIQELHRVIFHGILHLCGYKDKSKLDQAIMRSKEDFYLKKFFQKRST